MSADPSACNVPVLLLKTKSSPNDGYEDYFRSLSEQEYLPTFVPVLEHRFKKEALENIRDLITNGGLSGERRTYAGLIFTSQRAVEAFAKVVEELRLGSVPVESLIPADVPLYVVGPATARGLQALNLPALVVGEASGSGEELARFILEDYHQRWCSRDSSRSNCKPLLFLVGEQRRDIIPKTLQSEELGPDQRIELDELVVYETAEMGSFRSDFESICIANRQRGVIRQWVIVFSPTGCRAMLEALNLFDPSTRKAKTRMEPRSSAAEGTQTFIATIGPTTRDYLRREFNIEPAVCAPRPSPEGIGEAIQEYMHDMRSRQIAPGSSMHSPESQPKNLSTAFA